LVFWTSKNAHYQEIFFIIYFILQYLISFSWIKNLLNKLVILRNNFHILQIWEYSWQIINAQLHIFLLIFLCLSKIMFCKIYWEDMIRDNIWINCKEMCKNIQLLINSIRLLKFVSHWKCFSQIHQINHLEQFNQVLIKYVWKPKPKILLIWFVSLKMLMINWQNVMIQLLKKLDIFCKKHI